MKLGQKLLLAPLLTGLVALTVGGVNGWLADREASNSYAGFKRGIQSLHTIAGTKDQVSLFHTGVYRTITVIGSYDDAKVKGLRSDLASKLDGVKQTLATMAGVEAQDDSVRQSFGAVAKLLDKYKGQADTAIDLSSVDPNTGIAALQSADATFGELTAALGAAVQHINAQADTTAVASQQHAQQVALGLALLGVTLVVGTIGASVWMQRRIVADLRRASALADEVAHGNLALDIRSDSRDEVGDLLRSLAAMQLQLRALVGQVRTSAENIQVASVEVASGNADLSTRTEQAAANLQQTASSVEQLTSTVRQSADSAATANQLASSAASVAQRGGSVVSQVVATMQEIDVSSKKIVDIIGTIDGIAFQTNILALNAAVEAARAGEQGRGFAVVASEVRSLAQRSAEAAKQIKLLIGASVDKVASGTKLVGDAGTTMTEIVASVRRVSDIIGEITAAASEQSVGIGQVNTAVNNLDQMTQQNAALVEQSAAAAESLRDQAGRLAGVVATFKLAA